MIAVLVVPASARPLLLALWRPGGVLTFTTPVVSLARRSRLGRPPSWSLSGPGLPSVCARSLASLIGPSGVAHFLSPASLV